MWLRVSSRNATATGVSRSPTCCETNASQPRVTVTVALGAQLKATVTVTRGCEAFVSQHVGDLDTPVAVAFLEETLSHMLSILEVEPVAIACDLHPDFPTSRLANRLGPPVIPVQHHHAHIATLAAEHHIEGPLLGLSLDGFGLGSDGGAWGGEREALLEIKRRRTRPATRLRR